MDFSCSRGFVFLAFILICWNSSMADPRTTVAGSTCTSSMPPSQSDLASNFVPAMANLSSLVDRNRFGIVVVGSGPSAVYALCQCFRDLNSTECTLCYSEVRSVLPKCYPRSGGRLFLDGCFGRYENFSFFGEGIDSVSWNNCSFRSNSSRPNFMGSVRNSIRRVTSDAQSNNGFAVGSYSASGLTLYVLAQCWESLNRSTCNSCLQTAASSIIACSPALEGRSLHAGCYMRYSTRLFWNADNFPTSSGKKNYLWVVLVAIIGVFLALSAIWVLKTYCKPKTNPWADPHGFKVPANISSSKLNFKFQELRKATCNFDMSNKLGQGSYGSVYKGVLNGREIAVKRLFMNTRQWSDKFFNEVDLISQVHHRNLVKLLGCSMDGPESLLVYEYYFNKSLDLFLFDENKAKLLDWSRRLEIIQGVAEGLCYLHEESVIRIIHRDIKASNILLDDKFKPKITDFGLARSFAIDQTHLNTGVAGTLGYMAPEYVVHGHLTEKADVYSFGILLLEIMTRRRCTTSAGVERGEVFVARIWNEYKANNVLSVVDEFIYEDGMKDELVRVIQIGLLCIQVMPGFRPSMSKVVEILRSGVSPQDLYPPTNPPFLDHSSGETAEGESSSSRLT